jgi:hypothetical protein
MLAIHDEFTDLLRGRLETIGMGLGLVRLLQDAGRTEEARTTLCSLEHGCQGRAAQAEQPRQEHRSRRVTALTNRKRAQRQRRLHGRVQMALDCSA